MTLFYLMKEDVSSRFLNVLSTIMFSCAAVLPASSEATASAGSFGMFMNMIRSHVVTYNMTCGD